MHAHATMSYQAAPPPLMFPPSGIYKPPVIVTLKPGNKGAGALYYTIERPVSRSNADQVDQWASSEARHDTSASALGESYSEVGGTRYTGPIELNPQEAQRVRVVAFQVSEVSGKPGHSVSAVYFVDRLAPSTQAVQTTVAGVPVPVAYAPLQEASTRSHTSAYTLSFASLPDALTMNIPFNCAVQLNDNNTPVSFPQSTVKLAVSLESELLKQKLHTAEQDDEELTCPLLLVRGWPDGGATKNTGGTRWGTMAHVEVYDDGKAIRCADTIRRNWSSYALGATQVGPDAPFCGFRCHVASLSRCIVGLLRTSDETFASSDGWKRMFAAFHISFDDQNNTPVYRVFELGQPVEEIGTRRFFVDDSFEVRVSTAGVHLVGVSYLVNGLAIHQSTVNMDTAESKLGASKSAALTQDLTFLPMVCFRDTHALSGTGHPTRSAVITGVMLVEATHVNNVKMNHLVFKASCAGGTNAYVDDGAHEGDDRAVGNELRCVGQYLEAPAILRAWIIDEDYMPAVRRVTLRVPRVASWSLQSVLVALSFGLGGLGVSGTKVVNTVAGVDDEGTKQRKQPHLVQLRTAEHEEHERQLMQEMRKQQRAHSSAVGGPTTSVGINFQSCPISPSAPRSESVDLNRMGSGVMPRQATLGSFTMTASPPVDPGAAALSVAGQPGRDRPVIDPNAWVADGESVQHGKVMLQTLVKPA